jgi:hypothetical protein
MSDESSDKGDNEGQIMRIAVNPRGVKSRDQRPPIQIARSTVNVVL